MTFDDKMTIKFLAAARYHAKVGNNIPVTLKENCLWHQQDEVQATGAEYFVSQMLQQPVLRVASGPDGGSGFRIGLDVRVVWLGVQPDGKTRRAGIVLIDPLKTHELADIYVFVAGTVDDGFEIMGWTTHADLEEHKLVDYGQGPRLHMPVCQLFTIEHLLRLRRATAPRRLKAA